MLNQMLYPGPWLSDIAQAAYTGYSHEELRLDLINGGLIKLSNHKMSDTIIIRLIDHRPALQTSW